MKHVGCLERAPLIQPPGQPLARGAVGHGTRCEHAVGTDDQRHTPGLPQPGRNDSGILPDAVLMNDIGTKIVHQPLQPRRIGKNPRRPTGDADPPDRKIGSGFPSLARPADPHEREFDHRLGAEPGHHAFDGCRHSCTLAACRSRDMHHAQRLIRGAGPRRPGGFNADQAVAACSTGVPPLRLAPRRTAS